MSLALCTGALDVDMNIVNAQIAPDGFQRSFVLYILAAFHAVEVYTSLIVPFSLTECTLARC